MSAMTNLLVKDDTGTPVEFTLLPITDTPIPFWRASGAGIPVDGQVRLSASIDPISTGWKATVKLEVPVQETLGASGTSAGYVAPAKTAYVTTVITSMFCDKRSTTQDRANALKMHVGCLQGASSTTATGILTQATAGGGWLASSLVFPTMFRDLILPN
jgi:hypothetical protein